ncbi:MAG: serine hydrolase [Planctomycetota bacterium]
MSHGLFCAIVLAVIAGALPLHDRARAGEPASSDRIAKILQGDQRFARFVDSPDDWKLQVLLTVVTPAHEEGEVWTVERSSFRVGAEYFYPASTVKLYAAIASLRTLKELEDRHRCGLDRNAPLTLKPLFGGDTVQAEDPSNLEGGRITVAHELRKLFAVSDNRAFNRMYDLVGHRVLNESMWESGLDSVRLSHRLSVARSLADNRRTREVEIACRGESIVVPERDSGLELSNGGVAGLSVGRANMVGGERLEEPRSFARSNYTSLIDLQDALMMVLVPEAMHGGDRFGLSDDDRTFLSEAMELYPRQFANPVYDAEKYPDEYAKFLLPGVRRFLPEEAISIRGKIGLAYGFTVENSCVLDRRSGTMYFLAGCIYTNANSTMNDGVYEYDAVAFPFWADLGEAVSREVFGER